MAVIHELSAPELDRLLARASSLLDERDRKRSDALRQRLAGGHVRVLVAGEAKRGKSTLINALLGRDLMPRGALPVTSLATEVRHGDPEQLIVDHADGTQVVVDVGELRAFATEVENPHNVKHVDKINVQLATGLPHPMLTLIDTPGVGSVLLHNDHQATVAYQAMDAVVVVLTGDAPLSAAELELLRRVSVLAVRCYVVLNKSDLIDPGEIDAVMSFLGDHVLSVTGRSADVLACSATQALKGRLTGDEELWTASGVQALRDALVSDVVVHRHDDLRRSICAAAGRLVARAYDEAAALAAAMDLFDADSQTLISSLDAALRETESRRDQALHVLSAQMRALLADLAQDAAHCQAGILKRARSELRKIDPASVATAPSDVELEGRRRIELAVTSSVEAWHSDWHERLAGALLTHAQRQQQLLDSDADRLRVSAHQLLGVDLTSAAIQLDPVPLPFLRLDFAPEVGWNSGLVTMFRLRGSARSARRRVLRHLGEDSAHLVDKSAGRARANLQAALDEATAHARATVGDAFTEQAEALRRAHQEATRLRQRSSSAQTTMRRALTVKRDELSRLHEQLDRLAGPTEHPDVKKNPGGAR